MQGTMGFKPLLRYNLQSVEFKMEIDKKNILTDSCIRDHLTGQQWLGREMPMLRSSMGFTRYFCNKILQGRRT